ncbi:MAG: translational GTPase TypA [Alphaproteobacteria bacterium]
MADLSLRNIAIIAHVDHGKTTLCDVLLRQAGTFRDNQQVEERVMDSNDLERERGITILAKCTSVLWENVRVNIVDTPGHQDFGGEVERILTMVDGVVLLVDAAEGPLPQTKFVLGKALKLGLRPIVLINKVDRPDARPDEVLDEIFDLFVSLDANEEQLEFPTLYASGKQGWADQELEGPRESMKPLMDVIIQHVPSPSVSVDGPFRLRATILQADNFLGRMLTGRIEQGVVKAGTTIKALSRDGELIENFRISKLLAFRGISREPVEQARAGDIITISGMSKATVADTLCDPSVDTPLASQPIDPPTIAITVSVNDSPLAGRDGSKVQSRVIRERLMQEAEGNVAIRVRETDDKDAFEVAGRGELQMAVLVETMRREGFELSISRPRVLFQEVDGQRMEPIEEVVIDLDEEFSGTVVEKMTLRKAELQDMRPSGIGKQRLTFLAPTRGLTGYFGEFLTDTRGTGLMNRLFHAYAPHKGPIPTRHNGVLVSLEQGEAVAYALAALEERGFLFIGPKEMVYQGMVIGEHSRDNDLDVNPLKSKQLTNFRASGKDDSIRLTPPVRLTLEKAISYIADDELMEVTPNHIRLRKRYLDIHERKRHAKKAG